MLSSTAGRTRVLLIDDNQQVRRALATLLSTLPDFEVCGEAATSEEAMRLISEINPDLAVVDISLKHSNGIDLIKQIRALNDRVRILVWSLHCEYSYAKAALDAGALGYITKEQSIDSITDALRQIARGETYTSTSVAMKTTVQSLDGQPRKKSAHKE